LIDVGYERDKAARQELKERDEECARLVLLEQAKVKEVEK
jgi:hypothetical protein